MTTTLPSGEVVLRAASAGVDRGASEPAEDPLRGYPVFGGVWNQRASTDAFTTDEPPIDPGRHHARDSAVIFGFDVASDLATWDVVGSRRCELSVEGTSALVIDAPSSGEATISGVTGDDVLLRCESSWGGHAAEARGVLP